MAFMLLRKKRGYMPARRTFGETATPIRVAVTSVLAVKERSACGAPVPVEGFDPPCAVSETADLPLVETGVMFFVGPGELASPSHRVRAERVALTLRAHCVAWTRSDLNAHLVR